MNLMAAFCGVPFVFHFQKLGCIQQSRRKGKFIQDSSLHHAGVRPSRCPAEGRADEGENQKSFVSVFNNIADPSCKGCVTVCDSFSGSERLERFEKVLSVQYSDGQRPLVAMCILPGLVCVATTLAWHWPRTVTPAAGAPAPAPALPLSW